MEFLVIIYSFGGILGFLVSLLVSSLPVWVLAFAVTTYAILWLTKKAFSVGYALTDHMKDPNAHKED